MNNDILVVLTETNDAGLAPGALEALGTAASLAARTGGTVSALATSAEAAFEASERGAANAHAVADGEGVSDEGFLTICAALIAEHSPGIVIVNRGGDVLQLCPRLAARTNGCFLGNTLNADVVDGQLRATAAVFGGAATAQYQLHASGPAVLTFAPGAFEGPERRDGTGGEVVIASVPANQEDRVRVVEPVAESSGPRLEDASVVVSGGRGLKEAERFSSIRKLAAQLGGMPGASRAIVDDGWATPAEQVGLTGTIVTPDVYIAIGISGASQHLAGCSSARTLVAVNTDPEAPIFRYAHYGIVDDGAEVLDELIKLTKDRGDASS